MKGVLKLVLTYDTPYEGTPVSREVAVDPEFLASADPRLEEVLVQIGELEGVDVRDYQVQWSNEDNPIWEN